MSIESILATDMKWGFLYNKLKVRSLVQCSCENEFIVKESFKTPRVGGVEKYIRETKCSECKEESSLQHTIYWQTGEIHFQDNGVSYKVKPYTPY